MFSGDNQQFTRFHLVAIKNRGMAEVRYRPAKARSKHRFSGKMFPQTIVARYVEKDLHLSSRSSLTSFRVDLSD
jgi:hypothetical protein